MSKWKESVIYSESKTIADGRINNNQANATLDILAFQTVQQLSSKTAQMTEWQFRSFPKMLGANIIQSSAVLKSATALKLGFTVYTLYHVVFLNLLW